MSAVSRWLSAFMITTVWLLTHSAIAQTPNKASEKGAVKLVAIIEAERLKLISGVMHGDGEDSIEDETTGLPWGGRSKFVLKFDTRLNVFLIDRTCATHPSNWQKTNRREGRYVLADFRDKRYFFDSRKNYFDKLTIDHPRNKGMLDAQHEGFLDPRTLGFSSCNSLFESRRIEHASDHLLYLLGEPIKPDDQGIMKVVKQEEYRKLTTWIDTKRGYTVVRYVFEWGTQSEDKTEFNTVMTLQEENLKWELANGGYIPVFYEAKATLPSLRDGVTPTKVDVNNYTFRKVSHRYAFKWSQVNEPLDPSVFDYHNFGLPAGTSVIDARAGKLAANGETHFPEIERLGKRTTEIPTQPWFGKSVLLSFVVGTVTATVVLVWRYRRRSGSR